MTRIFKDTFFWIIISLTTALMAFAYIIEPNVVRQLGETSQLTIMAFQRVIYLSTVVLAAWRFGVTGGTVSWIALIVVGMPYFVNRFIIESHPAEIPELLLVGGAGLALAVVMGGYESKRKLLKESEQNYRNSVDNSPLGVAIIADNRRLIYTNKAFLAMHGYSSTDELKSIPLEKRYSPESYTLLQERMRRLEEGQQVAPSYELDIIHSDGKTRHILASYNEVLWDSQQRVQLIYQDITRRKQAEMELKKHREHLEELVAQRTAELSESNEQLQAEIDRCKVMEEKISEGYRQEKRLRRDLEEQIKRRTEFTRAMVHELKTPLTPVLAASDVLASKLTWEPWKSLARSINTGAHDLNRRADELFDVAKGEIGMLSLSKQPVETYQVLKNVTDYVSPEANRRGLVVKLEASQSLTPVLADEERLRQMMLLLIDNALKFSRSGDEITIKAQEKGNFATIEVKDTGPGIPEEEQEWLFKPYSRPRYEGKHMSGLGLGLSLFKTLAELHGGQVYVESQPGKGVTFGFTIPLYQEGKVKPEKKAKAS